MRIKLKKEKTLKGASNANNIEDGLSFVGNISQFPEVGQPFMMQYKEGQDLWFRTSAVTEIINDWTFRTKNSIYSYEIVDKSVII